MSYTELEFEAATEARLPRLVFMVDESTKGPAELFRGWKNDTKQRQFRAWLLDCDLTIASIGSPQDLEFALHHALIDLRQADSVQRRVEPPPILGGLLSRRITRSARMRVAFSLTTFAAVAVFAISLLISPRQSGQSAATNQSAMLPQQADVGQQGDQSARRAQEAPALAVVPLWPYVTGCPDFGEVAMPPGLGGINDFHALTDIRKTVISAGAGSWGRGMLYLDLSAKAGTSVEVMSIQPHIDRRDLAPPAWIYSPDDGCGPPPPDRIFNFDLDEPKFVDKGVYENEASGDAPLDAARMPLGPNFVLSGSQHARIRINASSCRGNYEWNLDVQYVVTGDSEVRDVVVGPFQSYGIANNTTVYEGHQGDDGHINVDSTSTITGPPVALPSVGEPIFSC
jgi:hypothetical protein